MIFGLFLRNFGATTSSLPRQKFRHVRSLDLNINILYSSQHLFSTVLDQCGNKLK